MNTTQSNIKRIQGVNQENCYYYFNYAIIILYSIISLLFSFLIVYLTLKVFFSLFAFIHLCLYFVISLGIFHIFISSYWKNICFYSFRCSHWEIFEDFDHTISLILSRTAILRNIYFLEHLVQWLLLFIHQIPATNTFLFLLVKLWLAIAKSCQINWRVEIVKNCAITEVNELKNIYITVLKLAFYI